MPLEYTVEDYLVKQVEKRGGIALKGAVPGRRFVDRICILPGGVTLYAELKRPDKKGRLSVHQGETLKRLRALGQYATRFDTRNEIDVWFRAYDAEHGHEGDDVDAD